MDVDVLLQPRSDELPSGENLEYEPVFTALELAAQPGEERQEGDTIRPAEEPNWKDVQEKAVEVMADSHDIRAAVYYSQAAIRIQGIYGLVQMTEYIQGLLEQHWETCHPQLDEDDGDPTMRINAIQGLAGSEQVIQALRRMPLTQSRIFGNLSLRDMEIAEGTITAGEDEEVPDASSIGAAIQDTDPKLMEDLLEDAERVSVASQAIEDVFNEHLPGQGPSLRELRDMISAITKRIKDSIGSDDAEADASDEAASEGGAAGGGSGGALSGAVNSPADVARALDKIIAYYKRAEPSSPVPILLERAKKLVGADFMTIINDMAPRGLENVNIIGGLEEEGY